MSEKQSLPHLRKCIKLCQEHFGGEWNEIQTDEQIVEAVQSLSGGLSNTLHIIRLPKGIEARSGKPSEIILRFYGLASGDPDAILKDSLVYAILADRGLAPRLYGCFSGGRFEEYIPTRCLRLEEMSYPKNMQQIATKMAKFHLLDMPLSHEPKFLKDKISGYLNTILSNVEQLSTRYPDMWNKFLHLDLDLKTESAWLIERIYSLNFPVRFCHNDVQEGNLLISPDNGDLVLIDFEYSAYNFRGFDVANHFVEHCYCYTVSEPPFFSADLSRYPSLDKQREFFRIYLSACGIAADDVEQQMALLYRETQFFALVVHFFWALWSVVSAHTSDLEFDYMMFAYVRFKTYQDLKRQLTENFPDLMGILPMTDCRSGDKTTTSTKQPADATGQIKLAEQDQEVTVTP